MAFCESLWAFNISGFWFLVSSGGPSLQCLVSVTSSDCQEFHAREAPFNYVPNRSEAKHNLPSLMRLPSYGPSCTDCITS
jgi:hypothetical protein